MTSDLQRKPKRSVWRRLRIYFRRFRITVLLTLFVLVCLGAYLNQVGLPDFIKRPLLENLHRRGVDLEFSRLRLRGYRGIVAENVRVLSSTNSPVLPQFTARSADVQLDYAALAHLKLDVRGVTLRQGNLTWELGATNEPARPLVISNLTVALRFLPGNEWSLDNLTADYAGVRFQAGGRIANATALRDWPVFQGRTKQPPEVTLARLRRLQDAFDQIRFTSPPVIRVILNGDAEHPETFGGGVTLETAGAATPWGDFQNAALRAYLKPASSTAPASAEINLTADRAATRWAALRKLDLNLMGTRHTNDPSQLDCQILLRATNVKGEPGASDSVQLHAAWLQSLTNPVPIAGEGRVELGGVSSRWAKAAAAMVAVIFKPADGMVNSDPGFGGWNKLLPFNLELTCAVTNAATTNLSFQQLSLAALWQAPRLTLTNLAVRLAEGGFDARAALDIASRRLEFDGDANFDFHLLDSVLTPKSREWIGNFTWQAPPSLEMAGSLTLPAWTNRQPDWRGEVQPGIVLNGAVKLTNGTYRGISALAASTHLNYSNRVWHLPDLALTRPEGTLTVDLRSEEVSHDYRIKLNGAFDPRAIASLLDEKGQRGLGYFEFTSAPFLDAEVLGRWYERDRMGARASVTWTNFSFRGQHADRLEASLNYTNKILQVFNPRLERGAERVTADSLTFDFAANRAYLTNGYTDTDPMAIATAIGPKVAAAVAPYQFLQPPIARVQGVIPLKGERDADLHFDLDGGPFRWLKFNTPHIAGHIDWANQGVLLTNITASFYGGEARGNAWFDVQERGNTPFRFSLLVTNADLHAMMADLHAATNKLEGELTGRLIITAANTKDFDSWNGSGRAKLRNGLIWDTPIFGTMSAVMNTVVPGIGNSRASDAGGKFTITNSVIHTHDLDIRASGMRLQYDGTVDFSTRVEARVQAELLRDTWLVGPILSTALWPVSKIFEYKVSGTLAKPEMEPVYVVPKIFLAPLHPVKTIKGIFDNSSDRTNSPSAVWPVTPEIGN